MKPTKYKADLSGWNLDSIGDISIKLSEVVLAATAESLQHIFESDETYIYFPVEWEDSDGIGGAAVDDPLTIYLRVGMESDGEKPTFQFNLRDVLKGTMEWCASDGSFSEGLGRLSDSLKALAKDIDDARSKI
jgi:hypothetical protein